MFKLGNKKITAVYGKVSRTLKISGLDNKLVTFLIIVCGDNLKNYTRSSVTVDVSSVKDVQTALDMVEIVTEVKNRV